MSEATQHTGSCHCGAVRYTVELDLAQPVISCNCSICGRSGTMLAFVPVAKFTLERGADALTSYQFNKKHIDHVFCSTCGIKSFARGKDPKGNEMIAVNARCIEGVDLDKLTVKHFDGKSR